MGQEVSGRRCESSSSEEERKTLERFSATLAGGPDCQDGGGSLSGTIEAAILPLDPRGRGGVDREEVRDGAFGLDGGASDQLYMLLNRMSVLL